jgi:hypothetical protein
MPAVTRLSKFVSATATQERTARRGTDTGLAAPESIKAGDHFHRSPMTMQIEFVVGGADAVPPGIYKASFVGVMPTQHAEYGDGLRFDWKVSSGEHAGKTVSRTCKPQPTAANVTGKLIAGLRGEQLRAGERLSLASCIGREYTIVVSQGANGTSTRVESVG